MSAQTARRLEDRIRELCAQAAAASSGDFAEIAGTLRVALNEFAQLEMALNDLRQRAGNNRAASVLTWPEFPRDRRRT